jgi:ribA/ribD-fused uncharacterized protein
MITEFKDQYHWLSNFCWSPFVYRGITFNTNEHFYQAHKCRRSIDFMKIVDCEKPGQTKRLGKIVDRSDDWNQEYSLDVMKKGIYHKFNQNKDLKQKLINTGDIQLIEGNYWNDTFWGFCLKTETGENNLGKILMLARSYFQGV